MGKYLADLAADNGFFGTDHRLDILGTCASCREHPAGPGPAGTGSEPPRRDEVAGVAP
jgi:hypothetical protein